MSSHFSNLISFSHLLYFRTVSVFVRIWVDLSLFVSYARMFKQLKLETLSKFKCKKVVIYILQLNVSARISPISHFQVINGQKNQNRVLAAALTKICSTGIFKRKVIVCHSHSARPPRLYKRQLSGPLACPSLSARPSPPCPGRNT